VYNGCEPISKNDSVQLAALFRNFLLEETHMTLRLAYTLAACSLPILPALAQAPGLANANAQLREQETKDSQLMWWLHEVTDVYGPRLTARPACARRRTSRWVRW
jgi:hypothetical protein